MKIKTSNLIDAQLDWAVAKCEPDDTLAIYFDESTGEPLCHDDWADNQEYKPSTSWQQGGPIIERESITVGNAGGSWVAGKPWADDFFSAYVCYGPTPLIAAMRCYVASRLGEEVGVPDELTQA